MQIALTVCCVCVCAVTVFLWLCCDCVLCLCRRLAGLMMQIALQRFDTRKKLVDHNTMARIAGAAFLAWA